MSITETSLRFAGIFEAEVLIELMLRYWTHPYADDEEFRNGLLESAVEVLASSISGERLLQEIPPDKMNLIAAVWYAEWSSLSSDRADKQQTTERQEWLDAVRHALPSCFCDPSLLD